MKIKPLGDKILVQRVEAETQTASGIFLPESAQEKPQEAKVVAIGPGKILENGKRAPFQVKADDIVILGKWGGTEISFKDQDYLILSEDEVLAVVG